MKQLEPDPWQAVPKKYAVGERVRGRVTHLVDFGAFVELEPGVEGMIHVSEMSWTKRVKRPSDVLSEGDLVEAAVLDLQPGVEGLAHVSELSWDKKLKKPGQVLKRGQEVDAKVLKVDVLNRRLSLSLKDLTPDPWATFASRARVEQVVRGRVVRKTNFGAFVELAPGVEGLCHASEIPAEDGAGVEVGQEHDFKIIKVNPGERRIGLSLKAMTSENERRAVEQYRNNQPRSAATLGEILISKGQIGR